MESNRQNMNSTTKKAKSFREKKYPDTAGTANSLCSWGQAFVLASIPLSITNSPRCVLDGMCLNAQMAYRTVVGFWHMNELDLMANIYRWQFHVGFSIPFASVSYLCMCVDLRYSS